MKGYGDEYRALIELSESLGLDIQELSNLNNVIAKLIGEWKGPRGTLHLFITLLEKARKKKQIEKQLEKIRLELTEKANIK